MKPLSTLTYKVCAFTEIEAVKPDDFVNWACDMLILGHESNSLIELAGLNKPVNFFESKELLTNAFKELNLKIKFGQDAVLSYSKSYVESIANKSDIRFNLNLLKDLCIGNEYEDKLFDYYLLFFCWQVFDENNTEQGYWNGATPDNIEEITVRTAKEWLLENKENYSQK